MPAAAAFDSTTFRQVLGRYPTGVTIITSADELGPVGLAIGSFVSVSLDPPLVGFFVSGGSSTWARISQRGSFCVNVLGEDHEHISRTFSSKADDRFAGLGWRESGSTGSPILDSTIAWIDCSVHSEVELGDHVLVVGEVLELHAGADQRPLIFFGGAYSRLA